MKQSLQGEGSDLILALTILSQQNGGNERLAHLIECEWIKNSHKRREYDMLKWNDSDVRYLLTNYNQLPMTIIAKNMNRTYESVEYKVQKLALSKMLKRPARRF